MARYGLSVYGLKKYGEVDPNTVVYNSNIEVLQPNYTTTKLSWDTVTASISDPAITAWKIIKTIGGAPDHPNDGIFVVGENAPVIASSFTVLNDQSLPTGTEVTYSFWVFNENDWLFCGSSDAITFYDDNESTLKIVQGLPGAWTSKSGESLGIPDDTTDLWRFVSNFGFYYDKLRAYAKNLNSLGDYRYYPHSLLGTAVTSLGFSYEPTLGDNYHRALYRSGNLINSLKGSKLGLRIYVTALTHFDNSIIKGKNLMLDYNDSSFEEAVGSWASVSTIPVTTTVLASEEVTITTSGNHGLIEGDVITVSVATDSAVYNGTYTLTSVTSNTLTYQKPDADPITSASNTGTVSFTYAAIASKKYSNSILDLDIGSPLTPPVPTFSGSLYTLREEGYGLLTARGSTDVTTKFNSFGTTKTVTRTIPVIAGQPYNFSGYVKANVNNTGSSATLSATISWFDHFGNKIGADTDETTVTITTSWQYFKSIDLGQQYAPAGAKYAGVNLLLKNAVDGDLFVIDMLSFYLSEGLVGNINYGIGESIFEDSRTVKVQVNGVRTNYLPNPGFDNGSGGWVVKDGTLLSVVDSGAIFGGKSGQFTATAADASVSSNWISLKPETEYIFSAYVLGPSSGGSHSAKLLVEYSSPEDSLDQTILNVGGDGVPYYNTTQSITYSDQVLLNGSTYTRLYVVTKSPDSIDESKECLAKVSVIFTGTGVHNLDGLMLEEGDRLMPFFQGNGSVRPVDVLHEPFAATEECIWESRLRTNFISNPSFEGPSVTGWTAGGSATLTGTATYSGISPLYGTAFAKIVAGAANGYIQTVFNYPEWTLSAPTGSRFPHGGENVTASAYIYGPAGDYTISINGTQYSQQFSIPADSGWTRIHVTGLADKYSSSYVTPDVTIKIASSIATGTWHVDGVQVEFSDTPSPFVDPTDVYTVTLAHPQNAGEYVYAATGIMTGGGRSYFWPRFGNKVSRLENTIPDFLPIGSSFSLQLGEPTSPINEDLTSLVKSSSFENSLFGWDVLNNNTTMTRIVGRGYRYGEIGCLGASWVKVENSTISDTYFGIYQTKIIVDPNKQYSMSTAVKVLNSNDYGNVTILVDWVQSDGVTSAGTSSTITTNIVTENVWKYVGDTIISPSTAAYAKVTLKITPTTRLSSNSVLFDRVILKKA